MQLLERKIVIEAQSFAGNLLDRGGELRKETGFIQQAFETGKFCILTGRKIGVRKTADSANVAWIDRADLAVSGVALHETELYLESDVNKQAIPTYVLGKDNSNWRFAVDISKSSNEAAKVLLPEGCVLEETRSVMWLMPESELAVAGQAVALASWHEKNAFCGSCGASTVSIEAGAKRACTADPQHRVYPRLDPVVIMLVESVDGTRALLGRSKVIRQGMYTCLSGFVEQGESIEEAVVREVREEAGLAVGQVDIVGSQPWPIGRGGSCELMIGCIAKAALDDVFLNTQEMDDARWFDRGALAQALENSKKKGDNPYLGGEGVVTEGLKFYIPPPMAIAHHLIKLWVQREQPWFSKL